MLKAALVLCRYERRETMLKELNQVIDYIEKHLTDDLSLELISEYAGVSDYHFRKIFFYLSGLTLSEYIKNRRLSEACKDLLHGEKVTDVALNMVISQWTDLLEHLKNGVDFYPQM